MTEEDAKKYEKLRQQRKSISTQERIKRLKKFQKKLPKYINLLEKTECLYAKLDKLLRNNIKTEVTEKGDLVKNSDDLKIKKIEKANIELEIVQEKLWKYSELLWDMHIMCSDEHDRASGISMAVEDLVCDIYETKTSHIDDDYEGDEELEI